MHAALYRECKPFTLMRRQGVGNVLTAVAAEAEGHAGARAQGVPPKGGLSQHRQDTAHDSPRSTCATYAADMAENMCMAAKQSPCVQSFCSTARELPSQGQVRIADGMQARVEVQCNGTVLGLLRGRC